MLQILHDLFALIPTACPVFSSKKSYPSKKTWHDLCRGEKHRRPALPPPQALGPCFAEVPQAFQRGRWGQARPGGKWPPPQKGYAFHVPLTQNQPGQP